MRPAALFGACAVLGLAAGGDADATSTCRTGARPMARVELYFGAAHVGPAAWGRFLTGVVTPRFPDGLTSFEAVGQWRGRRGPIRERSRVLVILYRSDATSDARIEAIRRLYATRFRQTSVLRVDNEACVSF